MPEMILYPLGDNPTLAEVDAVIKSAMTATRSYVESVAQCNAESAAFEELGNSEAAKRAHEDAKVFRRWISENEARVLELRRIRLALNNPNGVNRI